MKNKITFFFLISIFLFSAPIITGQMHYLDKYEGIPIIAVYTNVDGRDISPENYARLRELGAVGILSRIHNQTEYDIIKNNGLKVIPYNIWSKSPINNILSYYTDAVYTKWEAEYDTSVGYVNLVRNNNIGKEFIEGGVKGFVTNSSTPGELLYGPGYAQLVKYQVMAVDTSNLISYTANFKMKIKQTKPLPAGDSVVCIIQVVASNPKVPVPIHKIVRLDTLRVSDFEGDGWNVWQEKKIVDYKLNELNNRVEEQFKTGYISAEYDSTFDSNWMQYKVIWAGRTFLDLYVDYIEVSDIKGRELKNIPAISDEIKNLVTTYSDTSRVLAWMGLNEPKSIDSYEPIRIVDSLIQEASGNQLRYYATFTTGWKDVNGQNQPGYGGNGNVLKVIEFIHRTKIPYISFNLYNYDYPYYPSERPDYYIGNIDDYVIRNLKPLLENNIPFAYSTQSGNFYIRDTATCINNFPNYHNPSPAQMMYHINLGLLFGMKELTMGPFFTLKMGGNCPDSLYREGLVDAENNQLTTLGLTWRDKVVPNLSGLMGKTLKKLKATKQINNIAVQGIWRVAANDDLVDYIKTGYSPNNYVCAADLGYFEDQADPAQNYFMILNRWYSTKLLTARLLSRTKIPNDKSGLNLQQPVAIIKSNH